MLHKPHHFLFGKHVDNSQENFQKSLRIWRYPSLSPLTGGGTEKTPSKPQLKAAEFLREKQLGKELRQVHTVN